jgi:alpha-tubulin suppressor-like RCC1 family protein
MRNAFLVLIGIGLLSGCASAPEEAAGEGPLSASTLALALPGPLDIAYVQAKRVTVGRNHACALTADDRIVCWGSNAYGQLGIGTFGGTHSSAQVVKGLAGTPRSVQAGAFHTCATVGSDNIVQCWGLNSTSQVGGTADKYAQPYAVSGVAHASLALGDYHSCATTDGGAVVCWGKQHDNRLGDGVFTDTETRFPQQVEWHDGPGDKLTSIANAAAGNEMTCAHHSPFLGGEVFCWGTRFGFGGAAETTWMVSNEEYGGKAQNVAVGTDHGCASLSGSGNVFCWGRSETGQAGVIADVVSETVREPIPGLSDVGQMSAGTKFTCAHLWTNVAKCWGKNDVGQLGNGTTATYLPPVTVSGLSNVAMVAARASTGCAVDSGYVSCWGNNTSGQLGNGAVGGFRTTPQRVRWPEPVKSQ